VNLIVPESVLFVEANPAYLGIYRTVRRIALKNPRLRFQWTLRFVKTLCNSKGFIEVPLSEGESLRFSSTPLVLDIIEDTVADEFTNADVLGEPRLIFSNEPIFISPKHGLRIEGPYSRNNPSQKVYHPSEITLHVIYPSYLDKHVRDFVEDLTSGCDGWDDEKDFPGFNKTNPPFYSKLIVSYYPQQPSNLIRYKICTMGIKSKYKTGDNVILFILPDNTSSSFYHELKRLCYQHNLASQFVRAETIRRTKGRAAILWNIAITLYTKASGTPWKIGTDLLDFAECSIGLQCKIQRRGKAGRGDFFIGSADIFNAFGEYISCALHQGLTKSPDGLHVDSEFMESLIKKAVERYREEIGSYPPRVVIHRKVEFNDEEIKGVEKGLKDLKISAPCFLVHLQENNLFRGYYTGDPNLFVPRTAYFLIGSRNAILFTTGLTEGRYEGFGTPKPTQINIRVINRHEEITPSDIEKICKGVIGFTRLRWNTTRVGVRNPLTLQAADRIGELVKFGYTGLEYRDIRDIL